MLTLNIGLNIGDKIGALAPASIEDAHCVIKRITHALSGELTAVCTAPDWVSVYDLAVQLRQEAISGITEAGEGFVIGPKAEAWGEFNPVKWLSAN